jgi:hypothetical protein
MSRLDTSAELFALKSRLEASAERLLIGWLGQPTRKAAREWRWGRRGGGAHLMSAEASLALVLWATRARRPSVSAGRLVSTR